MTRPSPNPGPWPAIGVVAVALAVMLIGCGTFHPFGLGTGPNPVPTPKPGSPNDATWHLVGFLSIGAMVLGVAMCVYPPPPRPVRGLSIALAGLSCLILSNLMLRYELAITIGAGILLLLSAVMVGWFLWTHRSQLKARLERGLAQ